VDRTISTMLPSWTARAISSVLLAVVTLAMLWRMQVSSQRQSFAHQMSVEQGLQPSHYQGFWQAFYRDLNETGPRCPPIENRKQLDVVGLDRKPPPRPVTVVLDDEQHLTLKTSHAAFLDRMRNRDYQLPYIKGRKGIVMTAGGTYLIHALVSVRMIRRTGTHLPIEIFLRDHSEGDPRICEHILPELNAKCIALSDTLGVDINTIGKYQYKVFAMLLSSFEDMVFLDADCFPIFNPETLLSSAPFTTHGLVLWPDFWYSTESPLFFDIANIAMPPMDEQQVASEAGQILYSKRTHEEALLLAAYYNFYGPNFYYKLHSQGALGEGDKETFRWSAVASRNTFYQVKAHVQHLGFTTKDGEGRYNTMAQLDPIADLAAHKVSRMQISVEPKPFMMHAHNPKLDPGWMFQPERRSTIFDSDGSMRRIWYDNTTEAHRVFGVGNDPELGLWKEMRAMACEYNSLFKRESCQIGGEYLREVFGVTTG